MPYPALIGMARRLATHWCVCVSASAEKTQKIGQMALGFHAPHCQQCCCMICMRTPLHVPMHMNMGLLRPYYHNCEMECSYACRAPPQQPSNLQNLPKKLPFMHCNDHGGHQWDRMEHKSCFQRHPVGPCDREGSCKRVYGGELGH